jgi:CRISPR-associated exonuclease Cas4
VSSLGSVVRGGCLILKEDDYIPISYLNDFLFCERRAALHLLEGIWRDNQYTLEGAYAHRNVDVEADRKRGQKRQVTGMWVVSHRLGLIGRCDLVEFLDVVPAGEPLFPTNADPLNSPSLWVPYPIDFKRGKKRRWDNDEVQLCAQAICLEEMLGTTVPTGAIFHIKSQTRQEVVFDDELRAKTEQAAVLLAKLLANKQTPLAKYHAKCRGCSLFEWCMPKALRPRSTAKRYLESIIQVE